jgi:hypothetical protein
MLAVTIQIALPADWQDIRVYQPRLPDGVWHCVVDDVELVAENRLKVTYKVLDDGPFAGHSLNETFHCEPGNAFHWVRLKQLLEATGVRDDGMSVALSGLRTKTLYITTTQRSQNGKTYVNVSGHMPPPQANRRQKLDA